MDWQEDTQLTDRMRAELYGQIRVEKPLPHVTELIYCLTRSWYNRFRPLPPTAKEVDAWVAGVGLERVLLANQRRHVSGERDGIHYEADFVSYDDTPGELKSTRMSMRKLPAGMPETWKKQVLSYWYIFGADEFLFAAMCLMGDYAPPFPSFAVWRGTATEWERSWNWIWMLTRKEIYLDHVEVGEPPQEFTYNEEWECEGCPYKLLCDANKAVREARGELSPAE